MRKLMYILMFLLAGVSGYSQMIADITEDVATEFGTYQPYLVDVTPACSAYAIDSGFTNVVNFNDFTFTAVEESLLFEHAFAATPSSRREVYDIYNEARESEVPIFVSCDALLHTYHVLYDKILQTAELKQLVEDIEDLTEALYAKIEAEWASVDTPDVKEALRLDLAYFSVAKCLLDTTFRPLVEVEALVDAELSLIGAHVGFAASPIFGYDEDYSQFVPRGHYTKSDTLMRYFRCMMWYGRMTFAIDAQPTRMAVLLVHAIHNVDVGSEPGVTVWDRVYRPTMFFVGKSDDIHLHQYTEIMEEVYGVDFASLPPDSFANNPLLGEFMAKAAALPLPQIASQTFPRGFRFMGQRFIPDSYILQELVCNYIPGPRALPKGLDVLSVLGSDRAYEILDQVYGETAYAGYAEKMDSLKLFFDALPDATWAQNLYWNWLYCLMPFTFVKGFGYPLFMQSTAWLDKELNCALGSWTELRHDTILYAKQSYTWGALVEPATIHGYVEANPWFFTRLASLTKYMYVGLDELGLLYGDFGIKLLGLENLLLVLKGIAEKELTNQALTYGESRAVTGIGAEIAKLIDFEDFSNYTDHFYETFPTSDDQMPVVADVHTDPIFTNTCLEEGVGYPFNLYVIVPLEGELKVTWGVGFSYYEFPQPMSDRLTDEAWQEMLQTGPPSPPVWVASFVDMSQLGSIPNPTHYYKTGDYCWHIQEFGVEEDVFQGLLSPGLIIYPNPFTRGIVIRYSLNEPQSVSLKIYDLSGRFIRTLVDEHKNPGSHKVMWTGKDIPSGVYFVKLMFRSGSHTTKILHLR